MIASRRRVNASSMFARRFVARIASPSKVSIRCRRYALSMLAYRSCASRTSLRLPKIASASSKSRTAFTPPASAKIRSRFFSVSPTYLSTTVARLTV